MTKEQIEQKIKEILSKDDRFKNTTIAVNYMKKKDFNNASNKNKIITSWL